MKKRKSEIQVVAPQAGGECCASSTPVTLQTAKATSEDSCCEQPTDGSSCCDKNESKPVNIQKTGCC